MPSVGLGCPPPVLQADGRRSTPRPCVAAVKACEAADHQVVTVAMLGHKADLAFMALGPDLRELRRLQTGLQDAGLEVVDSYVSLTEVSEYAEGMPERDEEAPAVPAAAARGQAGVLLLPDVASAARSQQNWYTLPYDERDALMREHGTSGRTFAGRVLQVITGSTGLDDFEWGVTLFAVHPDDLKAVVYQLRFDRASAIYARVRAVLHRAWSRRSRSCWPALLAGAGAAQSARADSAAATRRPGCSVDRPVPSASNTNTS